MSSWSGEGTTDGSARAQVEPLAALVAVFAVGVGLSLYAGVLDATLPTLTPARETAPVAADRFVAEATAGGAVVPPISVAGEAARPDGFDLNATVSTPGDTLATGPPVPDGAECDHRTVSVRVEPGRIRPGRLEVCVWPAG